MGISSVICGQTLKDHIMKGHKRLYFQSSGRHHSTVPTLYMILSWMIILLMLCVPFVRSDYLDQEWKSPRTDYDSNEVFGLCVADIDADDKKEILVGTDDSSVEVFDGITRLLRWN